MAEAQLPGMRRYTLIDGYTATNGYIIQQDSRGFIWLGTENGAMRFDGKKFQIFRDELWPADQEILSCNPFGKDKVLFVPLLNNITWYSNGEVFSARRDPRLKLIRNTGKNNAFTDAFTGNIWLTDEGRFGRLYCFSDKHIRSYRAPDPHNLVIAVRNNRFLVIDTARSLWLYDTLGRRYSPLRTPEGKAVHSPGYLETLENGRFLAAYSGDFSRLDIFGFANDTTLRLLRSLTTPVPGKAWRAFTDSRLELWASFREGGLAWLPPDSRGSNGIFSFMNDIVVNCLFVDREQNLWISGRNNSLYFMSREHFRNALLVNAFFDRKAIPRCISGDTSGNMAIAFTDQARLAIRSGGHMRYIALSEHFYEGPREICPLGNNRFLVLDKELALVDGHTGAVRYFKLETISYKDMFLYRDGGLLLASQSRLEYLPAAALNVHAPPVRPRVVHEGRTSAVASLADGTILIGTPDGLLLKKGPAAPAQRVRHPVLSHINITDIAVHDAQGALIATNAQGIFYYHAGNRKVRLLPVAPGAAGLLIRKIFRQREGLYWLSTGNGAIELKTGSNGQVLAANSYTFYDGLPSNNVTSIYVHRDTAFISTAEGAGILPLKDSGLHMNPPLIYLNSVSLRDSVIQHPAALQLQPGRNSLLITLSAISYESLGNVMFRYQMEGLSAEWATTDNPEIRFAGLPPGSYTFRAYAVNAKGQASRQPVVLTLRVMPAFWQTLAFKACVALAALLALYLFLKRRAVRSALKKYELARQQRRLAELELEAIKAQINPHFIYNCLNSIQYFNYAQQHEQSRRYLDLFARLIRSTMQYSRQSFITVAEEADYLEHYLQLEQMRFREQLQYRLILSAQVDRKRLLPSMMIQPYIENALKHGIAGRSEPGLVIVRFEQAGDTLVVSIEDDGPGFPGSNRGNKYSLGLRLSGSRAETYNQLFGTRISIGFENKHPGNGLIVHIKIPPIPNEHLFL